MKMNETSLDKHLIEVQKRRSIKVRPLIVWSVILLLGLLFDFMNWPGFTILILPSSAGLFAYSLNGVIASKNRDLLSLIVSILGTIWFLILIVGMLFNGGYPYNEIGFLIYLIILVLFFVIYYFTITIKHLRVNNSQPK